MELIKPRDFEQLRLFIAFCMIGQYFTFITIAFSLVIMTKICNMVRDFTMFQDLCFIFYRL